jgi:cell division protein FtsL
MGGGGGPISGIFNVIAEQDAAHAEEDALQANANWYMEQAEFAHRSTVRELKIQNDESKEFYGEQVSGIARGGLDMSGSPLLLLAQTKLRAYEEKQAIIDYGNIQYREASLKGEIANRQRDQIKSGATMSAIGGVIGIATGGFMGGYSAGIQSGGIAAARARDSQKKGSK